MLLIGAKIQEYRKKQGLSQEEFAAKVGVTRQAVSKWETGLSRPLISGEVKVNGRTFYYYAYSVMEYEKNETLTVYRFYGYCDLEDGSIYSIFGHSEDYPEAAEEAYYLEWMNINVF